MRKTPTSRSSRRLPRLRPTTSAIVVAFICIAAASSYMAPSFTITNSGGVTSLGVPLTETFDTLASTGTNIPWTDNSTIPGWWSTRTTYNSKHWTSKHPAPYIASAWRGPTPTANRALSSGARRTGRPVLLTMQPG